LIKLFYKLRYKFLKIIKVYFIMKNIKVLNYKNFDKFDIKNNLKINIQKPEKNKHGIYFMENEYFMDSENNKLFIQTPLMSLKNDSIYEFRNKKYINVEFNNNSDNKALYNFLIKFDNFLINYLHKNFENWFSKSLSLKTIEKLYYSALITPNDNEVFTPYLQNEVPYYNNKIDIIIYNKNNKKVDDTIISKNKDAVLILLFKGMIVENNKFIPILEVQQMKIVEKKRNVVTQKLIIDDDLKTLCNNFKEQDNKKAEPTEVKETKVKSIEAEAEVKSIEAEVKSIEAEVKSIETEPIETKPIEVEAIKPKVEALIVEPTIIVEETEEEIEEDTKTQDLESLEPDSIEVDLSDSQKKDIKNLILTKTQEIYNLKSKAEETKKELEYYKSLT